MSELFKKALLTGIGLAALTKDKVEQQAKKIADELKLSEQEGKKLAQDLLKQSEESRKNLRNQVEELVKKTLQSLHLPSRDDLERIEKRLKKLEKQQSDK